jgi:hypothetical protein
MIWVGGILERTLVTWNVNFKYHVAENRAFLPQAVECAVVEMMSTNRSVGSQPELKSRPPCRGDVAAGRIFTPRPLWFLRRCLRVKMLSMKKERKK